jgi:hypothetical protein
MVLLQKSCRISGDFNWKRLKDKELQDLLGGLYLPYILISLPERIRVISKKKSQEKPLPFPLEVLTLEGIHCMILRCLLVFFQGSCS